jgi:hypothetical protein
VRRLPSFNAEFTASTPLTRIRDIAHRSDIPHELKQEIKHTIQVDKSSSSPICCAMCKPEEETPLRFPLYSF